MFGLERAHVAAAVPGDWRGLATATPGEAHEWHAAMAQARAQGSFVLAGPQHCAVATRP